MCVGGGGGGRSMDNQCTYSHDQNDDQKIYVDREGGARRSMDNQFTYSHDQNDDQKIYVDDRKWN